MNKAAHTSQGSSRRGLGRGGGRQAGTSLLEVLISMLLLSVGLLGMAGLTTASSGYNKQSQLRATAGLLVSDYAERARANVPGFDAGNYAKATAYAGSSTPVTEVGCTNAVSAACTSIVMAQLDQTNWLNIVRARLPGGDAYVTTNTGAGSQRTMDIWIMWRETDQDVGLALSPSACPAGASAPSSVKCLYFRVGL